MHRPVKHIIDQMPNACLSSPSMTTNWRNSDTNFLELIHSQNLNVRGFLNKEIADLTGAVGNFSCI